MKIYGLQKLTLLDYPEKTACTVFTAGCNFRCPFCHNASLVTHIDGDEIGEQAFFDFLRSRQGLLQGVCVTGGEPTVQPDLLDFLVRIKSLGFLVKLDTNGARPDILKRAVSDGLVDYVAMDIKNSPARYGETVGIDGFDTAPIEESVRFLLGGSVDYEFRTTVVRQYHTAEDIAELGRFIKGARRYYLQVFKDSGDLIGEDMSGLDRDQMNKLAEIAAEYVEQVGVRGL